MKIEELIDRVNETSDRGDMRRLGRTVAHAIVRQRDDRVSRLVAELERVEPEDDWTRGFLAALGIVATMGAVAARERDLVRTTADVASKKQWQPILDALDGWKQPSELADSLGIDKGQLSRELKQLASDGLVEWVRGEADRRVKLYRLTPRGCSVLDALSSGNDDSSEAQGLGVLLDHLQAEHPAVMEVIRNLVVAQPDGLASSVFEQHVERATTQHPPKV